MLIVFTGHRDRIANTDAIHAIEAAYPFAVWMHGGADGFDSQVHAIGVELGKQALPAITSERLRLFELPTANVIVTVRPAYGMYHAKSAPIIRNEAMVDKMRAGDLLVACWDGRKGGGTFATINYAKRKGVTVQVVEVKNRETN